LDDLVGHVGTQVDGQGERRIGRLHQVAQFFGALQLVFFQPFLDQLLSSLLQNGSAQLEGFELVQLTLIEQDAKVLEEWGRLTGLGGYLLELADRLRGPKDALGCIRGYLE